MEYRELIREFGARCGLEDLEFDGDGVAVILADDIRLSFMEVSEARQLVMFADVAEKPDGNCERLYETLLGAQHLGIATGGATFSVSPDGMISIHRTDMLADLDVERLSKLVEDFLNLIDTWRENITAYRPDESSEDEDFDEDDLPPGGHLPGSSAFLQV